MRPRTLAHLSDLHLGLSPTFERRSAEICRTLLQLGVDHVVVTGDVTHKGRHSELRTFEAIFDPLLSSGRMTVVPGNHDRVDEDAGSVLMAGERVRVTRSPGLWLIQIDSTAERNRSFFAPHGELSEEVLAQVEEALSMAPEDALCVILLHHHPLPMPEETWGERFAATMGWPHSRELELGHELVRLAEGRCDLILHGHRHIPHELVEGAGYARALRVFNGGATTELMRFRLFTHARGKLVGSPTWIPVGAEAVQAPRSSAVLSALHELRGVFV
ncbi:MAG: metallophosphoesterase [Myxococcaceae bacterium]